MASAMEAPAMDPQFSRMHIRIGLSPTLFTTPSPLRSPSARSGDSDKGVSTIAALPGALLPLPVSGLGYNAGPEAGLLAATTWASSVAETRRESGLASDLSEWLQVSSRGHPRRSPSSLRHSDGGSSPAMLSSRSCGDSLDVQMHTPLSSSSRRTSMSGRGVSPMARPATSSHQGSSGSAASSSHARTPSASPPRTTHEETTAAQFGPCSKVWTLPPRIRRRKKVKPPTSKPPKPKRDQRELPKEGPKRRGAYTDEIKKRNTALTRILKSCIRCRMNRGRCDPDPSDPYGACLTCKGITGPTLCKMPCYRYIITDASLYREQRAPYQVYSRRWQSMDIVNIPATGWASSEIRTIVVSPNDISAPFEFQVREFIPVEGDLLEEQWMTAQGKRTIPLPRYAVADMHQTANDMKRYVERNISNFIAKRIGNLDQLLWETYTRAFRHVGDAKTPEERSLMSNAFRLWVICRLCSNPVHICGPDKLGGQAIHSPDSLHNGRVPMPVIMTAQFECINYTTFLRPWSKAVLKQLNELVLAKRRDYWLTIYYAMFVLLHSCAMLTRRDEETARQYDMPTKYANPESIRAHHAGVQTMLAHFHFINKGVVPFSLPQNDAGKQELAKAANLTDEQVDFVWMTSRLTNDPERAAQMRYVREAGMVGHDLYWISMLYDKEWVPLPND